jgi:hypothetical protein
VIRIRYADLPAGLHIRAVARGKDTIIYLLPGLTAAQRQAALRRARTSGRMGQGPRLPVAGVAGAMMVDRLRATVRNGAAAMRAHPAIFVPPMMIVLAAAVAYVLLVSVSIKIREPQASPQSGAPIAAAVAPPPGSKAGSPGSRSGSLPGSSGQPQRPAPSRTGGGHRAAGPSPSPSPAPSADPSPSASPSPAPVPSPSPAPTPSAGGPDSSGSGSGSSDDGGLCLDVGLLGVCLSQ